MLIALKIFLGIIVFNCLLVCCLYFRKDSSAEQSEKYSSYRETLKSTRQGIRLLKLT